jgi:iron complex outermembrane receptor protein
MKNNRKAILVQLVTTTGLVLMPTTVQAHDRSSALKLSSLEALLPGNFITPAAGELPTHFIQASDTSSSAVSAGDQVEKDENDIVVTGSRIARTTYNSPSPVAVIDAAQIEQSGTGNVYDLLNRSPQFGVGRGPASAGAYSVEAGAQFVNLRGLGLNRTLVLINGQRRVSGASSTSAVDLSSLPANVIQRLETVTGGAAAIYGADAVSGAVNVLLKDDFDGIELTTRQGLSSRGDAYSASYGVLLGGDIGERGHVTVAASYNFDDDLYLRDRSYTRRFPFLSANPANTGPSDGIFDNITFNNVRFLETPPTGHFIIDGVRYTYDNGVRPIQSESRPYAFPDDFFGIGGDGFDVSAYDGLRSQSKVFSTLAHLTYDVLDGVKFTADLQFSQAKGYIAGQPQYGYGYQIGRANPFLPADVAALMDANGLTTLSVSRTNEDHGASYRAVTRQTYTGVAKLDGQLTSTVNWSVFGQYGRFTNNDVFGNNQIVSRLNEALDVVAGPNGPMCASAAARAAGCAPLNVFGANVATPEAVKYFHYDSRNQTTNTQTVFGAQLNGDLFDLPAGPLAFSVGAEYRRETTRVVADPLAVRGELFDTIGANLSGKFNVKEIFGEVLVPILRDQPLAERLEVDGAVRFSDYSSVGSTTTWKAGLVYAPISDIRFRVTRSRSVRAPNLNELFSPGSLSNQFYFDPCNNTQINATPTRAANCAALGVPAGFSDPLLALARFVQTSGNPNLSVEKSDSLTLGAVLQPSFLPGFSASVDYFDIKIKGAIDTISVDAILSGCVDGPAPVPLLCNQIIRRGDSAITQVNLTSLNIGESLVRGIDFTTDYRTDAGSLFGDPLVLGLSLFGSYYIKNEKTVDTTKPENVLKYAGSILAPRFRGTATATASAGPLNIAWTLRYISPSKVDLNVSKEFRDDNDLPRKVYNDVFVSYDVTDKFKLGAGVNNIFDVHPPAGYTTFSGNFNASLYDNVGTYFFMTAGLKI